MHQQFPAFILITMITIIIGKVNCVGLVLRILAKKFKKLIEKLI